MTVLSDFILSLKDDPAVESFEAGEMVFMKGDPSGTMVLLIEGDVQIMVDDERVISTVPGPHIFGEMGLVDSGPRSASVIAVSPSKVLRMDRARFVEAVSGKPELALSVMEVMAQRLRAATAFIR